MNEKVWPKGYRCGAVFSFDVDDEFVMRQIYGPKKMYYITQGEYDARVGVWRVLNTIDRLGIKGTFCVVWKVAEKRPDVVRAVAKRGHEIAAHGYDHRPYYKLTYKEETRDVKMTLKIIEKIVGSRPVGHRTPEWNPSVNTVRILDSVGGFIWRSDSLNDDLPYHLFIDGKKTGIVELPVAATLDDWPLMMDKGMSNTQVFEFWRDEFDVLYEEGKLFMLTTHPLLIGRPSPIKTLQRIIEYVKTRRGTWIARADEIGRWWLSRDEV